MDAKEFDALFRAIEKGDVSAFEVLHNHYCKKIKAVIFIVLGKSNSFEDIFNEILIKLWNKAKRIKNIINPDAWMYGFTKNEALNYFKSKLKKTKNDIEYTQVPKKEINKLIYNDQDLLMRNLKMPCPSLTG